MGVDTSDPAAWPESADPSRPQSPASQSGCHTDSPASPAKWCEGAEAAASPQAMLRSVASPLRSRSRPRAVSSQAAAPATLGFFPEEATPPPAYTEEDRRGWLKRTLDFRRRSRSPPLPLPAPWAAHTAPVSVPTAMSGASCSDLAEPLARPPWAREAADGGCAPAYGFAGVPPPCTERAPFYTNDAGLSWGREAPYVPPLDLSRMHFAQQEHESSAEPGISAQHTQAEMSMWSQAHLPRIALHDGHWELPIEVLSSTSPLDTKEPRQPHDAALHPWHLQPEAPPGPLRPRMPRDTGAGLVWLPPRSVRPHSDASGLSVWGASTAASAMGHAPPGELSHSARLSARVPPRSGHLSPMVFRNPLREDELAGRQGMRPAAESTSEGRRDPMGVPAPHGPPDKRPQLSLSMASAPSPLREIRQLAEGRPTPATRALETALGAPQGAPVPSGSLRLVPAAGAEAVPLVPGMAPRGPEPDAGTPERRPLLSEGRLHGDAASASMSHHEGPSGRVAQHPGAGTCSSGPCAGTFAAVPPALPKRLPAPASWGGLQEADSLTSTALTEIAGSVAGGTMPGRTEGSRMSGVADTSAGALLRPGGHSEGRMPPIREEVLAAPEDADLTMLHRTNGLQLPPAGMLDGPAELGGPVVGAVPLATQGPMAAPVAPAVHTLSAPVGVGCAPSCGVGHPPSYLPPGYLPPSYPPPCHVRGFAQGSVLGYATDYMPSCASGHAPGYAHGSGPCVPGYAMGYVPGCMGAMPGGDPASDCQAQAHAAAMLGRACGAASMGSDGRQSHGRMPPPANLAGIAQLGPVGAVDCALGGPWVSRVSARGPSFAPRVEGFPQAGRQWEAPEFAEPPPQMVSTSRSEGRMPPQVHAMFEVARLPPPAATTSQGLPPSAGHAPPNTLGVALAEPDRVDIAAAAASAAAAATAGDVGACGPGGRVPDAAPPTDKRKYGVMPDLQGKELPLAVLCDERAVEMRPVFDRGVGTGQRVAEGPAADERQAEEELGMPSAERTMPGGAEELGMPGGAASPSAAAVPAAAEAPLPAAAESAPRTPEGAGRTAASPSPWSVPLAEAEAAELRGDFATPRPPMADQGQQTTPDKLMLVPKRPRRRGPGEHLRPPPREGQVALIEVGLDHFGIGCSGNRPRRHQIPPLCHWRHEHFIYERLPGSLLPTVSAVVLAQPVSASGQVTPLVLPHLVPLRDSPQSLRRPACASAAGSDDGEARPSGPGGSPGGPGRGPPGRPGRGEPGTAAAAQAKPRRCRTPARDGRQPPAATPGAPPSSQEAKSRRSSSPTREGQRSGAATPVASADAQAKSQRSSTPARGSQRSSAAGTKRKAAPASPAPARAPAPVPAPAPAPVQLSRRASRVQSPAPVVRVEAPVEEGYVLVPGPEGSQHHIGLRACLDTGLWMVLDVHVPPRSGSVPEPLPADRSILVSVLAAEPGALVADLDGEVFHLGPGDQLLVRPGRVYSWRNDSGAVPVKMKMVVMTRPAPLTPPVASLLPRGQSEIRRSRAAAAPKPGERSQARRRRGKA